MWKIRRGIGAAEQRARNAELSGFNELQVDREMWMIELKRGDRSDVPAGRHSGQIRGGWQMTREPAPHMRASPKKIESLRDLSVVAGSIVACVGLLVLAGWLFGVDTLKSVLPGMATMKANTAVCLLLAGAALVLLSRRREETDASRAEDISASARRRLQELHWFGTTAALVVLLVAGLTMVQYLTGADFGIDQLLFLDTQDPHTIFPGRMVEATALGFLFSSVSLLLLGARSRTACLAQQTLAVCAGVFGLIAVLGYIYSAQQLYRFSGYASMALHTAAALLALAIGLIFARPDGLAGVLAIPGPAAQVTHRLLPVVLLAPAILGWLVKQGSEHGYFGERIDIALLALSMTLSLALLVWWTARALGSADATRRETETTLRESETRYRSLFEHMLDGFAYCRMLFDEHGHPEDFVYLSVNDSFGRLTGMAEVIGKRATQVIPGIKELNPELFDIYGRVASTGNPERFEIDFKPLSLCLTVSVYSPAKGYFVAVFDDISNRKHTEAERSRLLAEVKAERDRLSALVASIRDEVWFADTEKRFTLAIRQRCGSSA